MRASANSQVALLSGELQHRLHLVAFGPGRTAQPVKLGEGLRLQPFEPGSPTHRHAKAAGSGFVGGQHLIAKRHHQSRRGQIAGVLFDPLFGRVFGQAFEQRGNNRAGAGKLFGFETVDAARFIGLDPVIPCSQQFIESFGFCQQAIARFHDRHFMIGKGFGLAIFSWAGINRGL
jgi:hypothetical protein